MNDTRRGIIWDMDGVLVDTARFHYSSWRAVLAPLGIEFTPEQFRRLFGRNNRDTLTEILGRPPGPQEFEQISTRKEELFQQESRGKAGLMPGVLTLLEAFQKHGFSQAVGSSAPADNIEKFVEEHGLRAFFHALVSGADIPGKPDPAVFLAAARALDLPPSSCLVVEDSLPGLQASIKAGMPCLAVATTHPLAALSQASMTVSRLDQVNFPDLFCLIETSNTAYDT